MTARPLVTVFNAETGKPVAGASVPLPAVFSTPIRPDVVRIVHTNMNKNHRQPYAPSMLAGHQTSAESWGTGRAVSRIPRVPGGGTHRSGQGAFGNMCRGGHMFAPNRIWRRWHRKINVKVKRYAVCSALAASAIPALVAARGHRINKIDEIPLVVDTESIANITKTKKAVELFKKLNVYDDIKKVISSKKIRAGKGKARNRRYVQRLGPLVIYKNKSTMVRAMRNIPGVDFACVERLNLLQLAPGGHLGRLIIWTKDAFQALDTLFGTYETKGTKHGFFLPRPKMTNTDLQRILNSDEIQSVLRPVKRQALAIRKVNPFKNAKARDRLNPYSIIKTRAILVRKHKKALLAKAGKTTKTDDKAKTAAPKKQRFSMKKFTTRKQRKEHRRALFA